MFAITRSVSHAQELNRLGIRPIVWNWLEGGLPEENGAWQSLREDSATTLATILIAVSHAPVPAIPSQETHTRGLDNLVRLLDRIGAESSQAKWIYLSTTGVFGPTPPGDWVDEKSPVAPDRPGAIAAWAAEQWIAHHLSADRRVVLRPVGIYGPTRVPNWQAIRDRVPLQADPESYLNLIHVDDLAACIQAVSTSAPMQSDLYCVSDGNSVLRKDYYRAISEMGNWPLPVFESVPTHRKDGRSSRSDGNKRVRNSRLQTELAIPFQFPSYKEGLKSLLTQMVD